jgi:hypothetical protein
MYVWQISQFEHEHRAGDNCKIKHDSENKYTEDLLLWRRPEETAMFWIGSRRIKRSKSSSSSSDLSTGSESTMTELGVGAMPGVRDKNFFFKLDKRERGMRKQKLEEDQTLGPVQGVACQRLCQLHCPKLQGVLGFPPYRLKVNMSRVRFRHISITWVIILQR